MVYIFSNNLVLSSKSTYVDELSRENLSFCVILAFVLYFSFKTQQTRTTSLKDYFHPGALVVALTYVTGTVKCRAVQCNVFKYSALHGTLDPKFHILGKQISA